MTSCSGCDRADDVPVQGVLAAAVLVDVVAEMEDGVQVAAGGEMPVRGEVAGLVVGAGDHAETDVVGLGVLGGCRTRTGGGGAHLADAEAEPVRRGRAQSAYVSLDRVVGGRRGLGLALRDDLVEGLVLGDLPSHRDGASLAGTGHGVRGGCDARPQQNAVGQRVTRRDAVQEGGTVGCVSAGQHTGERQQGRGCGGGRDDRTAPGMPGVGCGGGRYVGSGFFVGHGA